MKKTFLLVLLLFTIVIVNAQYKNIQVDIQSGFGYPPCEPSIAISKTDPNIIVAGAILDKVYTSSDAGLTWKKSTLKSDFGVYGDPCIVSDYKGGFYYLHLSDPTGKGWSDPGLLDRIVCQYSDDNGKTWSKGSSIGYNGEKDQDKEWAAVDPKKNHIYATWTQFDKYNSKEEGDSSNIYFSCSKGGTKDFSKPVRINEFAGTCIDDDTAVEGAVPAAGINGEVYVAWALDEVIFFDRSTNYGKTWLDEDIISSDIIGGWDMSVPGIGRCNGMPVTKVDHSDGPNRGHVYINFADQRNGENNTDIWLIKSEDQGNTWTDPVRVNDDDSNNHQFFTWMDIDDSTGYIYIVFYDRRNYDDLQTDVYLATSKDGGKTFINEKISESPFIPSPYVFFGDYNNISAHEGIIRPIWTRYEKNRLSIWTAIIDKKD